MLTAISRLDHQLHGLAEPAPHSRELFLHSLNLRITLALLGVCDLAQLLELLFGLRYTVAQAPRPRPACRPWPL